MIFVGKNINPLIMKTCVYALYANTCLHKKFGTILIIFNYMLNTMLYLIN
jgi:hypothetical protein